MQQSNPVQRAIKLPEVADRVALSPSAIYAAVKSGNFPKPIKLTTAKHSSAWLESEINEFLEARVKQRDAIETDNV